MNSHMHQDVQSVRPFISHNINMWGHSSTFKLTVILLSDFNSEPDGPHVRRCAEALPPPLSCQGVCFLALPNGSNYTTDTYNCVLSLLMHHMNQCSAHPVPRFKDKVNMPSYTRAVVSLWLFVGSRNFECVSWCVLYAETNQVKPNDKPNMACFCCCFCLF